MSDDTKFIHEYDVREACSRAACAERTRERDEARKACAINEKRANGWRAEHDTARAEVATLTRELESTKPEWDATDGAHPCWWRGHDNGASGMKGRLDEAERLLRRAENLGHEYRTERDTARADVQRLQGALEAVAEYEMDWTVGADANLARVQAIAEQALRPPEVDSTSTPDKKESPGAPIGEARPAVECDDRDPDVIPTWSELGLPLCIESCPNHDGKRCKATGFRPDKFCEPMLVQQASELGRAPPPPDTGVLPDPRPATEAEEAMWKSYGGVRPGPGSDSDLLRSLESDIVEFKPDVRARLTAIADRLDGVRPGLRPARDVAAEFVAATAICSFPLKDRCPACLRWIAAATAMLDADRRSR